MFLIRPATLEDAPTLLKLAKMVHFINLPADPEIIHTKIVRSRTSQRRATTAQNTSTSRSHAGSALLRPWIASINDHRRSRSRRRWTTPRSKRFSLPGSARSQRRHRPM